MSNTGRAFAVKVEGKRLPVFPFSGLLNGCKGHKTHRFENDGTNQIRKTGRREVVFLQPLPQTLLPCDAVLMSEVPLYPSPCEFAASRSHTRGSSEAMFDRNKNGLTKRDWGPL